MHYLYVLYSAKSDKYYVGYTQRPRERLYEHNNAEINTYTSKHRPWVMHGLFEVGFDKTEAIRIERFIKRQKSRKLIEKIVLGIELNGVLSQLVRVPQLRD